MTAAKHPMRFERARSILASAVASHAFPAAVLEVGNRREALWLTAVGGLTYEPDAPPAREDTVFDLASLTKVISTTTLAMGLVERGRLGLDDPLRRWLPEWHGTDRTHVTVRDLLAHASGLTAWLPFYRDHTGRQEMQPAICSLPLEYEPRTRALYSDLGFILLGFILEDAGHAPLAGQFLGAAAAWSRSARPLAFKPPAAWRKNTAPTEVDSWRGRLLVGEVHDENAWALGGAAGHAGLFGTASATGEFARAVLAGLAADSTAPALARPETLATFTARTPIPGSSRALGWDTMLPSSSCGSRMSAAAIGHTGFTGTSLWIDPRSDVYVVLLTNRVHPSRVNEAIQQVRRDVHDAIMEDLGV